MNLSISQERLEGYKKALRDHTIPVDESLIIESGFHKKGGYEAMNKLLDAQKNPLTTVHQPADELGKRASQKVDQND